MGERIHFAVAVEDARASAALAELCRAAREAVDLDLVPRAVTGYDELARLVATDRAQIAWTPPIVGVRLVDDDGARPLAVPVRHGATSYRSALVARKGGPRSLEELRGRTVAWVDRDSTGGHVLVRLHLAAKGIDAASYFRAAIFTGSHAAGLDAVSGGRADAAAVWCRTGADGAVTSAAWLGAGARARWPVEPLLFTPAVPNDLLVGSRSLSVTAQTALVRMFCAPDERVQRALAEVVGTASLRVATDEHLAPLRGLLRAARREPSAP